MEITMTQLTKDYGRFRALDGITLAIAVCGSGAALCPNPAVAMEPARLPATRPGPTDQPFLRLSAGQTRLAGIAQAFLGQPSLLLLDELTRGLDVEVRERVLALARQPVPGRLILFSTHDPSDAGRLADHAIVLYQGQVIFAGKVGDLPQRILPNGAAGM